MGMTGHGAAAAQPSGKRMNLPSLTGLRFIAALMIFGVHAAPNSYLTLAGRTGVSFFFVLSGFVLTWSAQDSSAGNFYQRRIARIVPAYLVIWVVRVLMGILGQSNNEDFIHTLPGYFLLQAWFPDEHVYFAANGVAWSLSCEAFFYLCFPLLLPFLAAASRNRLLVVAALCVGVLVAARVIVVTTGASTYWNDVFPPSRIPEFILGMIVGVAFQRGYRPPLPLWPCVLLVVVGYLGANYLPNEVTSETYLVLPWCLLIAATARCDLLHRASPFRLSWLVHLGAWSYAFFLSHEIWIILLHRVDPDMSLALLVPGGLLLGIVGAYLLYAVVERPAERRLRPTSYHTPPVRNDADAEPVDARSGKPD